MAVKLRSVERGYWNRFVQVGMASLAISASALLVWPERPARVHADETYNETIVPPLTGRIQAAAKKPVVIEPVAAVEESTLSTTPALPAALQPIAQSLDIPSAPCNCGKTNSDDSSPIYVSAFGGASYFDTESKTSFGGIYGMNLTAQLDERLGVMATGLINNYSAGSQFGGTVGGYLHTKYYGESYERFGGTVAFDQFTDTGLGSPYLAQGRVLLKYQVLPSMLASVQYTQPLIGSSTAVVPGAGTTPFRSFQIVQGLLTVGGTTVGVGYVDVENSMTYSFMNTRPLTDRLSAITNASYDSRVGLWTGFVGMQFELSRPGKERWLASRSNFRGESGDVVRGDSLEFVTGLSDSTTNNESRQIAIEQNNQQAIFRLTGVGHGVGEQRGKNGGCPSGFERLITDSGQCFCVRKENGIIKESMRCPK